jgi:hypothetical protein
MLKYTSQGHKLSLVANDPIVEQASRPIVEQASRPIVEQASRLFLDGWDAHPTRWRIKFLQVPLYEGALGWHLWEKFFVENGEL